jgi:hypothetical protein
MRTTLKAVVATGVVGGILLLVATLALSALHWQLYDQAFQRTPAPGTAVVRLENPYGAAYTPLSTYFGLLGICCLASTAWASAVILPAVTAARQLFRSLIVGRFISATVVLVASAIAFSLTQHPNSFVAPGVIFLIGGLLGLSGFGVMAISLSGRGHR